MTGSLWTPGERQGRGWECSVCLVLCATVRSRQTDLSISVRGVCVCSVSSDDALMDDDEEEEEEEEEEGSDEEFTLGPRKPRVKRVRRRQAARRPGGRRKRGSVSEEEWVGEYGNPVRMTSRQKGVIK